MAAAAVPAVAGALSLGDIEVRSTLGQPLDARVPVAAQPGERFEAACFYISNAAALPAGVKLAMTLERSARGAALRIRSDAPVDVPAAALQLTIACPGREAGGGREYAVLLDPPGRVRAPSVPVTVTATLAARADDSLAGIARKVFPQDAGARALYLQALVDANPALAAAGDTQPIAAGSAVALPDLRNFAAGRKPRLAEKPELAAATALAAPAAPAAPAPAAPKVASAAREPLPAAPRPSQRRAAEPPRLSQAPPPAARAPRPEAPAAAAPPQPAPRAAAAKGAPQAPVARATEGPFVLRLSSAEMDLSRSRGIDEPSRSRLRERMLILDADDQVAALLSMRNNLRQLESRVTELQLKLAQMPAAFPDGRAAPAKPAPPAATAAVPAPAAPSASLPPKAAPAPPSTAPPTPAPVATPIVAAAPAPIAAKPATPVAAPQPAPAPPDAAAPSPAPSMSPAATPAAASKPEPKATPPAAPSKPAPAVATPKPAPPATRATARAATGGDNNPLMTWGAIALAVLLLLVLAAWWWRRRQAETAEDEAEEAVAEPEPRLGEIGEIAAPVAPPAGADDGRRTIASDAELPTRLRDTESGDLRQRYIDERFPEVASGAIRIDDPDSLVKGARLFYEDGALPRAVELLQFAVERRPQEPRAWLALFEIFRLERLTGEFAELTRRFRAHHGETDDWRKVQFFGREIDPANPLYRHEPVNTLETIGPREARKVAAANATFDPIAENWLNAPMDFENEVLANELRKALMTQAGLTEQDLAPNPMPALRNVEMFTVA